MKEVSNTSIQQGKRILETRLEKGLKQEELSQLSGISVPYISRLEGGKVNVSMRTLIAMSNALNVSLEYLENGTNENTNEQSNYEVSESGTFDRTFNRVRNKIRNDIDEIIFSSSPNEINTLMVLINKYNEISFLLNNISSLDNETQQAHIQRCNKYIKEINDELQELINNSIQDK